MWDIAARVFPKCWSIMIHDWAKWSKVLRPTKCRFFHRTHARLLFTTPVERVITRYRICPYGQPPTNGSRSWTMKQRGSCIIEHIDLIVSRRWFVEQLPHQLTNSDLHRLAWTRQDEEKNTLKIGKKTNDRDACDISNLVNGISRLRKISTENRRPKRAVSLGIIYLWIETEGFIKAEIHVDGNDSYLGLRNRCKAVLTSR